MKATTSRYLGILLLTQLAGCLGTSGTSATSSVSARISYDGATDPATLTQSNSATLLADAYQGGQAGTALGSTASLAVPGQSPAHPRSLLLSQALDNAVQQAIQNGTLTPGNATAVSDVTNQIAGDCGGQMSYSGTLNDETREFYVSLTFNNYCSDATTINGSATASGQTDTNAYNLDMYNDKSLAPNPFSVSFDTLGVSSAGSSFSASGYALITKKDETDHDETPDLDVSNEPVNPDNTPDNDDSAAADEQVDDGGTTTIELNCVLRDDTTKVAYKIQNFNIALTNGAGHVDADISGRYYDPEQGYVDITTPTPLRINAGDYWPSSGAFHATGDNDAAAFTALSNTTYQLDIDSNDDGTPDVTTTGAWSEL
jgi:hypothetical protein